MVKPKWLANAIAKADGYYSEKGEKLKSTKLTQEQIDEWNGTTPAPAPEPEVVEESAPAVEVTTVEVEEAPKPKKKKGFFGKKK